MKGKKAGKKRGDTSPSPGLSSALSKMEIKIDPHISRLLAEIQADRKVPERAMEELIEAIEDDPQKVALVCFDMRKLDEEGEMGSLWLAFVLGEVKDPGAARALIMAMMSPEDMMALCAEASLIKHMPNAAAALMWFVSGSKDLDEVGRSRAYDVLGVAVEEGDADLAERIAEFARKQWLRERKRAESIAINGLLDLFVILRDSKCQEYLDEARRVLSAEFKADLEEVQQAILGQPIRDAWIDQMRRGTWRENAQSAYRRMFPSFRTRSRVRWWILKVKVMSLLGIKPKEFA